MTKKLGSFTKISSYIYLGKNLQTLVVREVEIKIFEGV